MPETPNTGSQYFDDLADDELAEDPGSALAVQPEGEPVTGLTAYSETPNLSGNDLFIPSLRLAQGLTTEVQSGDARPGQWLVTGAQPLEEVLIVPLLMTRRRELRGVEGNREVACRSSDGVIGVGVPGGACDTCPMSKWTAIEGTKKRIPPACTFIYSYIVYVSNADALAILNFSRTSIQSGKLLNTMIMQKGLSKFAVTLRAASKSGPRGSYFLPAVLPAVATPELLQAAVEKAQLVR